MDVWSQAEAGDGMNSFTEAGESRGGEPGPPRPTLDLRVSTTSAGGVLVVHLAGELDLETSARFLDALVGTLSPDEGREVEIDLSGLHFLDVAGVRALIRVHDLVTSAGGRVKVLGLEDDRLPAARVLGLGNYLDARSSGGHEVG